MEKILATVLSAVILIIIILCSCSIEIAIGNYDKENTNVTSTNEDFAICMTSTCLGASSELIKTIDRSSDPCEDFWNFTCNGFINNTIFPNENIIVSKYSITDDFIYLSLNNLFQAHLEPNEPHYSKLMKKYYKACRNVKAIESRGLVEILSILRQLGGWPVIEGQKWDENNFNWIEKTITANKLGLPYEFFLNLEVDKTPQLKLGPLTPTKSTAVYGKMRLPIFTSESYRKFYLDLMIGVATSFNPELLNNSTFTVELQDAINFEIELHNIYVKSNSGSANSTISELEKYSATFPWFEFINKSLAPDVQITKDEVVYLENTDYVENLEKLLERTPKRVQANAFIWNIVFWALPFLHENAQLHFAKFEQVTGNRHEFSPRWLECTFEVLLKFKPGTTALFYKHELKKSTRENASEIAKLIEKGIRKRFTTNIENNTTDAEKRRKFLKSMDRTDVHIAFPEELTDEKNLENYYQGLEFNSENYLRVFMNLTNFVRKRDFLALKDPTFEWVAKVPALFSTWEFDQGKRNRIVITTGMLQGDYSKENLPKYMNFGALGFLFGAGYSHLYMKEYNALPNCFPDPRDQNKTDISQKILEDYRDVFGVDQAYITYIDWAKNRANEEKLPQFDNYTINQMYWIAHGNSLCIKYRPHYTEYFSFNYRAEKVNVALKNSQYFARDFNCPLGSKMNPKEKCAFL